MHHSHATERSKKRAQMRRRHNRRRSSWIEYENPAFLGLLAILLTTASILCICALAYLCLA